MSDLRTDLEGSPPGKILHGWRLPLLLSLVVLLLPLMLLSLFIGSRIISPDVVIDSLLHFDPTNNEHLVMRELRIPRTLIALVAGISLGLAGALMQSLTRNALAEPGTLGVNAGASAGVVIALVFLGNSSINVYIWFSFLGAGIASIVVHRLGRASESGVNPVRLILAGAGLSIMVSSITTMIVLSSSDSVFNTMRNWATGSLDGRGWESLPAVTCSLVVGATLCIFLASPLNSVLLGHDLATALGVNIKITWMGTNVAILLLAGGATAAVGPIGFVGLAAPHIARSIGGPDHKWLLAFSAVIAAAVLLLADILGRIVIFPGEIGAGIMTAFIGAPFFIWLVRHRKVAGL